MILSVVEKKVNPGVVCKRDPDISFIDSWQWLLLTNTEHKLSLL
jgi:hypothetical protein